MSSTITTIVHAVWSWLPQITTGLQFGSALIGFCLALSRLPVAGLGQAVLTWIFRGGGGASP